MREWFSFNWGKILGGLIAAMLLGLIGLWFYFANFFAFVDNYEVGYRFDRRTGQIEILDRTGWHRKTPFLESIGAVDTRPMQVCINANARVLNCKLVRFNPAGLQLFLEWHGRTWRQSASLEEILRSYAFDGTARNYPFLTVLRELKNEDVSVAELDRVAPVAVALPAPAATAEVPQ